MLGARPGAGLRRAIPMPLAPGPGTWRQPDSPHYPAGPLGGAVHVAVGPRQLAARVPRQAIGPQPLYRAWQGHPGSGGRGGHPAWHGCQRLCPPHPLLRVRAPWGFCRSAHRPADGMMAVDSWGQAGIQYSSGGGGGSVLIEWGHMRELGWGAPHFLEWPNTGERRPGEFDLEREVGGCWDSR